MILFALQLEWSHPAALLGLVALWLVWRWSIREPGPVVGQRSFWRPMRSAQILLLVFAMAGPVLNIVSNKKFVVVLEDGSPSCKNAGGEFLKQMQSYSSNARIKHVVFADREFKSDNAEHHPGLTTGADRALAKALAEMPAGYAPEIVLISDGRFGPIDTLRVAAQAAPIHVVPVEAFSFPEAGVSSLRAPIHSHSFESFPIEAIIESTEASSGTLQFFRGETPLKQIQVSLQAGTNRFVHLVRKDGQKFTEYRAELSVDTDTLQENNVRRVLVGTTPQLKVLVAAQNSESIASLVGKLSASGMLVDVASPNDLASKLQNPNNVDLVILADIPANSYSNEQIDRLHEYVHETGGGLLAIGDSQSFQKSRLEGSNIEPLLPISAPIRPGKPRETLAMVLVIDKSGSMLEEDRMKLAKEAAKESVKLLVATDKVGIVAFGDDFEWVSELALCGDKREVYTKISGLQAQGRTNMYSAMIRAHLALDQSIADRKHAVILTDGVASPGEFEKLSKEMAAAGITVSTISIGKDTDQSLLVDIARTARGRFHACEDPKEIRDVLVEETLAAVDTERKPVRAQLARQLPGLSIETAPPLRGYAPTTTKPGAELLLWATDGDPLLAWWPYGAGRVAAFTAAADDWQDWDDSSAFWNRLSSLARRQSIPDRIQIEIEHFAGHDHIFVDVVAQDGVYWNEYVDLSVDESNKKRMTFLAPGQHQLSLPNDHSESSDSTYKLHTGGMTIPFAVAKNYDHEFVVGATNESLLRKIAVASHGVYDVKPADVFTTSNQLAKSSIPVWSYLACLAGLLFVIEIALRRVLRPIQPSR